MIRLVIALLVGIPIAVGIGLAAEPSAEHRPPAPSPSKTPAEPSHPAAAPARVGGHGAAGDVSPASRPAAQHERLMKLAGRYTTLNRFSFTGADPIESRGEAILTPILGGRFLMIEEAGSMAGTPFEARKLLGYNISAEQYESIWAYTASTAMMTLRGTSDDEGRTIRLTGNVEGPEAAAGPYSVTIAELSADSFSVTLLHSGPAATDGAEMKTTYTRSR